MKQEALHKQGMFERIIQIKTKREAVSMNDIYNAAVICFARGIYSKMRDDLIEMLSKHHANNIKKKKKAISDFCHNDILGISLNRISKLSTKIMNEFDFYVDDDDVARICLVVDHFIINKISDFSFIATSLFFSVIIDEAPVGSEKFKELDDIINEVNFKMSEEKKAYKIKKAQEAARVRGEECFYDENVYIAAETAELAKGKAMGELFIKIFSDREYFNKIADKHRKKIGEKEYNGLIDEMKKQVENVDRKRQQYIPK